MGTFLMSVMATACIENEPIEHAYPPALTITNPVNGEVIHLGELVEHEGLVTLDPRDNGSPRQTAVRWSVADLADGAESWEEVCGWREPDADGVTVCAFSYSTDGVHLVKAEVRDQAQPELRAEYTTEVAIQKNAVPTILIESPATPASVSVGETLPVKVVVGDDDEHHADTLAVEAEYCLAGDEEACEPVALSLVDSDGVTTGALYPEEVGDFELYAWVRDALGAERQAVAYIEVTEPACPLPVIHGVSFLTTTVISDQDVEITAIDAEGADGFRYEWYRTNADRQMELDPDYIDNFYPAQNTEKHMKIQAVIYGINGCGKSAPYDSAEVIVVNGAPSGGSASVSPANPTAGDALTCVVSGVYDPDDDLAPNRYTWYRNGKLAGVTSEVVSGARVSAGASWYCTAEIADVDGAVGPTLVSGEVLVD